MNNKKESKEDSIKNKPFKIYNKLSLNKTHFEGNSPPEIFIGRYNYPDINLGILAPESYIDTSDLSMPEIWHKNKLPISKVLENRNKLIYSQFKANIKKPQGQVNTLQEISMAYKPVSTEFFLKKPPKIRLNINTHSPIIVNQAPLEYARLQENPKIKPKVDYLVSDTDLKASKAIIELHNSQIPISNINKILSAGLLGIGMNRKLVPTRWSITATDDTISKNLLKNIRYYPEINEILLFHAEYVGNHYEILLLPEKYSFEVIEIEVKNKTNLIWKDYENFNGRKYYASDVTGAYYANRLALTEYLKRTKRQATAIFFREVKPQYYAPLGVGILRETSREAFNNPPEKFNNIAEALKAAQTRLLTSINVFKDNSTLLKDFGKQTRLSQYF